MSRRPEMILRLAERLGVPLRSRNELLLAGGFAPADGESRLSFFSVTSVLGRPLDVTLSELAIESFLPADAETAATLRRG